MGVEHAKQRSREYLAVIESEWQTAAAISGALSGPSGYRPEYVSKSKERAARLLQALEFIRASNAIIRELT